MSGNRQNEWLNATIGQKTSMTILNRLLMQAALAGFNTNEEDTANNRARLHALQRFRQEYWDKKNAEAREAKPPKANTKAEITAAEADEFLRTIPRRQVQAQFDGTFAHVKKETGVMISVPKEPWL